MADDVAAERKRETSIIDAYTELEDGSLFKAIDGEASGGITKVSEMKAHVKSEGERWAGKELILKRRIKGTLRLKEKTKLTF